MTFQFGRAVVAEFADVKIVGTEGLRVTFSVERDKLPWPNTAELAVYNLNAATRAKLTSQGKVSARLQAGYKDQLDQIFFGVLDIVEHVKDGPLWVTRMSVSDAGEKCKQARCSTTFKKGTTHREIVAALLKALGLGEGNLSSFASKSALMRQIAFASSFHGNAVEELAYFLRANGLEFSVQDQKIQLLEIGKGAPNATAPKISPTSGLVGSPRLVKEKATDLTRKAKKPVNPVFLTGEEDVDMITTVEGECLLNGKLVPGVPFRLESESVNGDFLTCATRTTGDTHGPDWATQFKGMPLAS